MEKALVDYKAYLQSLIDGYSRDINDDSGWGVGKQEAIDELSKGFHASATVKADELLSQQGSNVFLGALSDKMNEVTAEYQRKLLAKFK